MLNEKDLNFARYELKYVTENRHLSRLRTWVKIHNSCFLRAYPNRTVNNIYFDTIDLDSFSENLSGTSSRTKIRLRWYGDTINPSSATFEVKSKRNRLGFKSQTHIDLSNFKLSENSFSSLVNHINSNLSDYLKVKFKVSDTPILINRYKREYFESKNEKLRATIDSELEFYDQRFNKKPKLNKKLIAPPMTILEIKVNALDIDKTQNVLNSIELPPSKSSKYVIGVQSFLNY